MISIWKGEPVYDYYNEIDNSDNDLDFFDALSRFFLVGANVSTCNFRAPFRDITNFCWGEQQIDE